MGKLVRWCSWSQVRERLANNGRARGPGPGLWARSGSMGHDLDTRQSSKAPGWPGCAWLAYQPGMWMMDRQRSGAGRVKQVLVIASLPICKCWLLLGGMFDCWIRGAYWWTMGWTEGLGEIPMLL
jgi:hypothetical protein